MRKPIPPGHWANICNQVEAGARYEPYVLPKPEPVKSVGLAGASPHPPPLSGLVAASTAMRAGPPAYQGMGLLSAARAGMLAKI